MLSEKEKHCCTNLLETLGDFDLQSLFRTVTQKQIAVETRKEAIDAILLCSESTFELLGRQKLKKEHLRDYLMKYKEKANIPKAVKADKSALVAMTINLWESLTLEIETTAVSTKNEIGNLGNTDAQLIGESFVPWFYTNLNSVNRTFSKSTENENWSSEHFWKDARLLLHAERPGETMDDEVFGSKEVSENLLNIVTGLNVFFHPNVNNNGVKGDMNRHGLLVVKSAGTLHQNQCVVGVFEQMFGLIRDPQTMDNWKIKNTELRIRISSEPGQIQCDTSLAIGSC